MSLADPALLAVGLLVAAGLAWAAVAVARRRAAALASAGVVAGGPGRGRARLGGVWFTIAGVAVLAIAVAGPAASVPVSHASGTVILAMDVSGSMAATDVAPSRLAAAKQAALSFINAQPASVDIGVVAFQQGGLEAALPTADHATASAAVRRLTAGGGTSLGDAILASLSAITRKTVTIGRDGSAPNIGYWPSATIVLFSDGQDEAGATGAAPVLPTAAPTRLPRSPRRPAYTSTPSGSAPPRAPPSTSMATTCSPRSTKPPSNRSRRPPAARTIQHRTRASSTGSPRPST